MSQQVQINYEQIAIQCQSICEVAQEQFNKLDEELAKLERTSISIKTEQSIKLAETINKERNLLNKKLEEVLLKAQNNAKTHSGGSCLADAQNIQQSINKFCSTRFTEFKGLLEILLKDSINKSANNLWDQNKSVGIDSDTQALLNSISDEVLRQFTYIAYLQDTTLRGEDLIRAGQALMGQTYESRLEEERKRIQEELRAARVDSATIEKVTTVTAGTAKEQITVMQESATHEIVGEKVRQKSLKIIMQAIKARGFAVDKNNIKIQRETNEVVMIAQKASGEKAEFRVFLDGKFIYAFHGYEGQACQKDIGSFMQDLEEVYGVHITKTQEIWSNPDKISTMKYQAMNTNKNKK